MINTSKPSFLSWAWRYCCKGESLPRSLLHSIKIVFPDLWHCRSGHPFRLQLMILTTSQPCAFMWLMTLRCIVLSLNLGKFMSGGIPLFFFDEDSQGFFLFPYR